MIEATKEDYASIKCENTCTNLWNSSGKMNDTFHRSSRIYAYVEISHWDCDQIRVKEQYSDNSCFLRMDDFMYGVDLQFSSVVQLSTLPFMIYLFMILTDT